MHKFVWLLLMARYCHQLGSLLTCVWTLLVCCSIPQCALHIINLRRVGGLSYSSLSVCLCVRVSVCPCVRAQFGLPGDLGITICT